MRSTGNLLAFSWLPSFAVAYLDRNLPGRGGNEMFICQEILFASTVVFEVVTYWSPIQEGKKARLIS